MGCSSLGTAGRCRMSFAVSSAPFLCIGSAILDWTIVSAHLATFEIWQKNWAERFCWRSARTSFSGRILKLVPRPVQLCNLRPLIKVLT